MITKNFPPVRGGIERMMWNTYVELSRHMVVDLVAPVKSKNTIEPGGMVYEARLKPLFVFLVSAFFGSIIAALKNRPALFIAGSGLVAPIVVMLGMLFKRPSVVFVHGLDLTYNSAIYQFVFVSFIRRADHIITNSENSLAIAKAKGIPGERIRILNPGVEIPSVSEVKLTGSKYEEYTDKVVLFSLGRLIPRKGLNEFVENSFDLVLKDFPEAVLLIVGTEPGNNSRHGDSIQKNINQYASEKGWSECIHFMGNVDDEDLERLWGVADIFIFPVIPVPGDVEGFGMVAVEAAAHGVPTVAFREGGIADAVEEGKSGILVAQGDYEGFSDAISLALKNEGNRISSDSCKKFSKRFEWNVYGNKLRKIILDVAENAG